mgnify:CR=1 FL=1
MFGVMQSFLTCSPKHKEESINYLNPIKNESFPSVVQKGCYYLRPLNNDNDENQVNVSHTSSILIWTFSVRCLLVDSIQSIK